MDIAAILVIIVALFHVQVFALEALLWESDRARKAFGTTVETARLTRPLAINQAVYNLFLAAGLLSSFLLEQSAQQSVQIFLLSCVMIAAVTGGLTVKRQIMLVQGGPALLAFIAVVAAG